MASKHRRTKFVPLEQKEDTDMIAATQYFDDVKKKCDNIRSGTHPWTIAKNNTGTMIVIGSNAFMYHDINHAPDRKTLPYDNMKVLPYNRDTFMIYNDTHIYQYKLLDVVGEYTLPQNTSVYAPSIENQFISSRNGSLYFATISTGEYTDRDITLAEYNTTVRCQYYNDIQVVHNSFTLFNHVFNLIPHIIIISISITKLHGIIHITILTDAFIVDYRISNNEFIMKLHKVSRLPREVVSAMLSRIVVHNQSDSYDVFNEHFQVVTSKHAFTMKLTPRDGNELKIDKELLNGAALIDSTDTDMYIFTGQLKDGIPLLHIIPFPSKYIIRYCD
jgi:hypothetical protein